MTDIVLMLKYFLAALVVGWLLGFLIRPRPVCPRCRKQIPRLRLPNNFSQVFSGSVTCPNCRAKMDNRGNLIKGGKANKRKTKRS